MSEFRIWMRAMGLNAKQVSTAAEMLGITTVVASHLSRGKRELSRQERLAMAALLAGLKPWDESETYHCLNVRAAGKLVGNLAVLAKRIADAAAEIVVKVNFAEAETTKSLAAANAAADQD